MRIQQHKGVEADQSHNYTIDLSRGELTHFYDILGLAKGHYDSDDSLKQRIEEYEKEFEKFLETK
jgi:hypothetical protein